MEVKDTFQCNQEGYLLDFLAWRSDFAEALQGELGRSLDEFDWQVIEFARTFYQEHHMMPLSRALIHYIKSHLNADFDSLQFQQRYTTKPLWVLAKLAGLPKPVQCI